MKKYRITVNGQQYDVSVEELGGGSQPMAAPVMAAPVVPTVAAPAAAAPVMTAGGAGAVKAPMPGTVTAVKVTVGQVVRRGEVLLLLEAMKMENEIVAPSDGTVKAIAVSAGQSVNTGEAMVELG